MGKSRNVLDKYMDIAGKELEDIYYALRLAFIREGWSEKDLESPPYYPSDIMRNFQRFSSERDRLFFEFKNMVNLEYNEFTNFLQDRLKLIDDKTPLDGPINENKFLSRLLKKPSDDKKTKIVKKWLSDNYSDLETFETEWFMDYVFYIKDGRVMFDYNKKTGRAHINYEEIWSFLQSVFSIEYEEVQEIMKEWVEDNFNIKISIMYQSSDSKYDDVEKRYKLEVKNSLTESSEDKKKQMAKKWLTNNYGDLEEYETDKYPDYIFYIKGSKMMLQYNQKNGYCYINLREIWSFLKLMFSMEYDEIQKVTKEWVEEHYKLKVRTTYGGLRLGIKR